MRTLFQGTPSSYSSVLLSLFLGLSKFPWEGHSCKLNGAWKNRYMARSRSNRRINWEVYPSSVSCLLKQILVNSSFILYKKKVSWGTLSVNFNKEREFMLAMTAYEMNQVISFRLSIWWQHQRHKSWEERNNRYIHWQSNAEDTSNGCEAGQRRERLDS